MMGQQERMDAIAVALDRIEAAVRAGDDERRIHYRCKVQEYAALSFIEGRRVESLAWQPR